MARRLIEVIMQVLVAIHFFIPAARLLLTEAGLRQEVMRAVQALAAAAMVKEVAILPSMEVMFLHMVTLVVQALVPEINVEAVIRSQSTEAMSMQKVITMLQVLVTEIKEKALKFLLMAAK